MKRQKMRRLLAMLVSISMILECGTFNALADSVDVSTETLELDDNEEDMVDYDDNLDIITEDAEDYTNNQINDQILEEDLGLLIEEDNADDLLISFEDDAAEETEQESYEELEEYIDEYAAGSTNVDGVQSW